MRGRLGGTTQLWCCRGAAVRVGRVEPLPNADTDFGFVPPHLVAEKVQLLQQVLNRNLAVAGPVHPLESPPKALELLRRAAHTCRRSTTRQRGQVGAVAWPWEVTREANRSKLVGQARG
eukprot:scaffold8553_cov100-Isochrysis_galbana.AAC.4